MAEPGSIRVTAFGDLNSVLGELVAGSRAVLGEAMVGAYLQGSFAVGDADEHSDCDFLVVTQAPVTGAVQSRLRAFHAAFHDRPGRWHRGVEGSYAPAAQLRRRAQPPQDWLFVDHQDSAGMTWSPHCNTLVARWSLRERGVTLVGPPASSLVDPVDPAGLRAAMLSELDGFFPNLATWIDIGSVQWAQRHAVTTLCRILYTADTGEVASKKAALVWARDRLDPTWRPLIEEALHGRARGWNTADLPRPGSVEETEQFAAYARCLAADLVSEARR